MRKRKLASLKLKDKSFSTKFRGYNVEEVDEFLDIVVRDTRTWFVKIIIKMHALRT